MRDRNRELGCRVGLLYCAFLDGCRYYQPVVTVIAFALGLGFGNSSSDAMFQGGRFHEKYSDVLLCGGAFWDENLSTDVAELFVCHSIVERIKLEVLINQICLTSFSKLIFRAYTKPNQLWLVFSEFSPAMKVITVRWFLFRKKGKILN